MFQFTTMICGLRFTVCDGRTPYLHIETSNAETVAEALPKLETLLGVVRMLSEGDQIDNETPSGLVRVAPGSGLDFSSPSESNWAIPMGSQVGKCQTCSGTRHIGDSVFIRACPDCHGTSCRGCPDPTF